MTEDSITSGGTRTLENWDLEKGRYGYGVASTVVRDERIRQEELYPEFWGERQNRVRYLAKLTEEFLEYAQAVNDADELGVGFSEEALKELTHMTGVAMGILQWELGARYLERRSNGE